MPRHRDCRGPLARREYGSRRGGRRWASRRRPGDRDGGGSWPPGQDTQRVRRPFRHRLADGRTTPRGGGPVHGLRSQASGPWTALGHAPVGGADRCPYRHDTLAEDTDLTMAIHRAGWEVVYQETALAWTEALSTLKALWSRRYRWCYGTIQATWKHRRALREGAAPGRVGIPYLLLCQVVLPLAAPLVDVFVLYGLVFLNPVPVAAYWVGFNILQLGLGILAFRLDHERPRSLWPSRCAVRIPPAHVSGNYPVGDQCVRAMASALAQARPDGRRDGGPPQATRARATAS